MDGGGSVKRFRALSLNIRLLITVAIFVLLLAAMLGAIFLAARANSRQAAARGIAAPTAAALTVHRRT